MEKFIIGGKKPKEVRIKYNSRALQLYQRYRWSEKSHEESSWGIRFLVDIVNRMSVERVTIVPIRSINEVKAGL